MSTAHSWPKFYPRHAIIKKTFMIQSKFLWLLCVLTIQHLTGIMLY